MLLQFLINSFVVKMNQKHISYMTKNSSVNTIKKFKISFKKINTDFLENKTSVERNEQLFGS